MFELTDTTFIIPIYVESDDRYNNAKSVLSYLNKHFKTNVIIHEFIQKSTKLNFISKLKNLKITHLKEKHDGITYHRTRQLNEMLSLVKTPVVCNYDIDVVLPVSSYIISEYLLKNKIYDVVYPYGFGKFQYQVLSGFDRPKFDTKHNLEDIEVHYLNLERSEYGHCIFFDTEKYRQIGCENENFISYGPEDVERYERCSKLDLKIHRVDNNVYHFEHSRTEFSDHSHKNFINNQKLYDYIKSMSKEKLIKYYSDLDYLEKYNLVNKKTNQKLETKTENKQNKNINTNTVPQIIFNMSSTQAQRCRCGEIKDKVRFNYCQRCGAIF